MLWKLPWGVELVPLPENVDADDDGISVSEAPRWWLAGEVVGCIDSAYRLHVRHGR